ncbi:MAG: type II toxin-antitoxin system ParD family antitoxin [Gammaproteobacteria bacterium]|nr:type II toxin-antitoxin system ParD family antitoxin [Gammaproteobacteria bacterium]
MNVSLTPELEKFIQEKVNCGMYTSASEVIRESLRLMHTYDDVQKQRVLQLKQAIDVGVEQLHQKKRTEGKVSREKMKQKIGKIAKGK